MMKEEMSSRKTEKIRGSGGADSRTREGSTAVGGAAAQRERVHGGEGGGGGRSRGPGRGFGAATTPAPAAGFGGATRGPAPPAPGTRPPRRRSTVPAAVASS